MVYVNYFLVNFQIVLLIITVFRQVLYYTLMIFAAAPTTAVYEWLNTLIVDFDSRRGPSPRIRKL